MTKFPETQNSNSQTNTQTQDNSSDQEISWNAILTTALAPLIPLVMAKLTGQKLSAPVNNAINEQGAIQQLTPVLQNMANTQNILLQEIILLKKNDQVFANKFQGLKLTQSKETKQIEYPNQNSNEYE